MGLALRLIIAIMAGHADMYSMYMNPNYNVQILVKKLCK